MKNNRNILYGSLIFSIVLAIGTCAKGFENDLKFYREACVMCYFYMPDHLFHPKQKLTLDPGRGSQSSGLKDHASNLSLRYENEDDRLLITRTISSERGLKQWNECCEAANKCCQRMTSERQKLTGGAYCRRQWDGWQCIPDAAAGETVKIPCPSYIYFFSDQPGDDCPNYATQWCDAKGGWAPRTDYLSCGTAASLRRRVYVNIGAFAFSIAFLGPAVIIFSVYKQLKVPRVWMHTNLFVSLILNGIVVIVHKSVIGLNALEEGSRSGNGIVGRNSGACKFALGLTKYTRMTTYMWMFCESFYLHKLIVAAFAEEKRFFVYYILGWVFPVIPVAIYAYIRKTYSDNQCWMVPGGQFEWIINAPMLISLTLNLLFLCNIIRVLITKLKSTHSNEPSQYRKAVRATLVLVPLFGLHFLLTIYLPHEGACAAIDAYYYVSYLIDGLQGFIVSLIFCYLNGEVLYLLKRSYERRRLMMSDTYCGRPTTTNTHVTSLTELTYCKK